MTDLPFFLKNLIIMVCFTILPFFMSPVPDLQGAAVFASHPPPASPGQEPGDETNAPAPSSNATQHCVIVNKKCHRKVSK